MAEYNSAEVWFAAEASVGFRAHLPVSEHSGIVAFKAALNELLHAGTVDLMLLGVPVKHKVVGESLVLSQQHLGLPWGHQRTDVTSFYLLLGHLRPDPEIKNRAPG